MKNESELTQELLKELRLDPNLVVLKHWDRGVGFPDSSVTGYGRTTWLEFKAPPPGHNLLTYVAASMNQLHTMCRLDRPAGWAHYVVWDVNEKMMLWRPTQLMFLIRQNRFQDILPVEQIHPESRHRLIETLYSPATYGPIVLSGNGLNAIRNLLVGRD